MNLISTSQTLVRDAIEKLWPDLVDIAIDINHPPKPEFGDYTCPCALAIAKKTGANPLDVAQQIADAIATHPFINRVGVSAPGFVNLFVNQNSLAKEVLAADWGFATKKQYKVSIEHTSVNPNKAAHVGHLRNACLGDTLARILREVNGASNIETQNYIDDLGLQVADSVLAYEKFGDPDDDTPIDEWFWQIYAKVNQLYETNPELKERRGVVLHEMERGENETAKQIVKWIVAKHKETFAKFGIDYSLLVYEHDIVEGKLWDKLFETLKEKGLIHKPEEGAHAGAWVVEYGDSEREDKILVRSNGIVTYTGKDLAYALWKFGHGYEMPGYEGRLKPIDMHVNVIDERQSYPQSVIRHVMKELGYPKEASSYLHLGYGVVKLSQNALKTLGVDVSEDKSSYSMSGRAGIGIMVNQLLQTAKLKQAERMDGDKIPAVVDGIAIGSIRYYMLKSRPEREIVFDFDEALKTDGNTGVYLQYAYARANNILDKLGGILDSTTVPELNLAEHQLIKVMAEAEQNIYQSIDRLDPSLLCDYAFDLANSFAKFYETSPVAKAEGDVRIFRGKLVASYRTLLGKILTMLGIPLLDKI